MITRSPSFIVSCQAEGEDPFNSPEGVVLFAKAAEMGGADGIRSEGIEKTKRIINEVNIPVIGLTKSSFNDGTVKITGSYEDVEKLVKIGCQIIAIDGTERLRENLTGPEFINKIKKKYPVLIMADISSYKEAKLCELAGADYISTTLNGYTPDTIKRNNLNPNFQLVKTLVKNLVTPIFAEGRISTPEQAKRMIDIGVYGVVVGTVITRPRVIANMFVTKINS